MCNLKNVFQITKYLLVYKFLISVSICCGMVPLLLTKNLPLNTLRLRQNGRHFADEVFKCIFLNENAWISLKNSLKFVPKVRISNIPALVQIMAWRRPGDKPLCEPVMVNLLTQICVPRPQWVKCSFPARNELTFGCKLMVNCQISSQLPISPMKSRQYPKFGEKFSH